MQLMYNDKQNILGIYIPKWGAIAVRRLTYVYAPRGRRYAIEVEDMASYSQDWEYIGEI